MQVNKKLIAGLTAAAVMFGSAGIATADNINNDLIATAGVMNLTAGGDDGVTELSVEVTNDDGKNGCNFGGAPLSDGATRSLVVAVTSSDVTKATVLPSSLTFTGCGEKKKLTVTPLAKGSTTISLTQTSNNTGGTFNLAPATFTVNVTQPPPSDTTPPVIKATLNPEDPDGNNGWYTSDVSLTWEVTDPESPLTNTLGCGNQNIMADQPATPYTCSATSLGGTNSETVTIQRDATVPGVILSGREDGASYFEGFAPAVTCEVTDLTSGPVDDAPTPTFTGHTAGSQTATCAGEDKAGNSNSQSVTYTMVARSSAGFHSPVRLGGDIVNQVKGGSTVPLKFQVVDNDGTASTDLTSTTGITLTVKQYTCDNGDAALAIDAENTGNTSLRYDSVERQFVQNWKTPRTPGCYRAIISVPNLAPLTAQFQVR